MPEARRFVFPRPDGVLPVADGDGVGGKGVEKGWEKGGDLEMENGDGEKDVDVDVEKEGRVGVEKSGEGDGSKRRGSSVAVGRWSSRG